MPSPPPVANAGHQAKRPAPGRRPDRDAGSATIASASPVCASNRACRRRSFRRYRRSEARRPAKRPDIRPRFPAHLTERSCRHRRLCRCGYWPQPPSPHNARPDRRRHPPDSRSARREHAAGGHRTPARTTSRPYRRWPVAARRRKKARDCRPERRCARVAVGDTPHHHLQDGALRRLCQRHALAVRRKGQNGFGRERIPVHLPQLAAIEVR